MTETSMTYDSFMDRFVSLYTERDYRSALALIESHGSRFPDYEPILLAYRGAVLSQLGHPDQAVESLDSAYEKGYWYDAEQLRSDPDFGPLQQNRGFRRFLERAEARRQEQIGKIRPERKVTAPEGQASHPLLMVLHGNSSSIRMTQPLWLPAVAQGWALASLQSSQPGWTNDLYVWNDVEKSLAEARVHFSEILSDGSIDTRSVVAGGFSMGAQIALRMALDPLYSLRGVIAQEAWVSEAAMNDLEEAVAGAASTSARVVLVAGKENAEYAGMAQRLEKLLVGKGFPCRVVYSSNPSHGYPPDFDEVLRQALRWIIAD